MQGLSSKRVLVVGGTSGIGEAVCRMAAGAGAEVVAASRRGGADDEIAPGVRAAHLDFTSDDDVRRFFEERPAFDHIAVTAARLASGPIRTTDMAVVQATMESKFWGAYRVARWARLTDGGSLTLVSGGAAVRPRPGRAVVAAACAALETLTAVLAQELAPVRVNCISPGLIDTPMLRAAMPSGAAPQTLAYPAGRVGRPEEIAQQILACMTNGFMTGAIIRIDGGLALA